MLGSDTLPIVLERSAYFRSVRVPVIMLLVTVATRRDVTGRRRPIPMEHP